MLFRKFFRYEGDPYLWYEAKIYLPHFPLDWHFEELFLSAPLHFLEPSHFFALSHFPDWHFDALASLPLVQPVKATNANPTNEPKINFFIFSPINLCLITSKYSR